MKIKEGIFLPEPYIRSDLTRFKFGGFDERYLGLPCEIMTTPRDNGEIAVRFKIPYNDVILCYTMHITEIEYK